MTYSLVFSISVISGSLLSDVRASVHYKLSVFYMSVWLIGFGRSCVNVAINVCILTMHVNVVMGGQLDEHLLF